MKQIELFNDIEIWKDVVGYPNYEVSNMGQVRSKERIIEQKGHKKNYTRIMKSRLLKQRKQNCGYHIVWLSNNGKSEAKTVHRLVANAFLGGNHERMEVNHKNGDKSDNRVVNLEWCTRSENLVHAYNKLNRARHWTKRVMCVETGEVFNSIVEASKKTNIGTGSISQVINGRNKTGGGYTWQSV